VNAAVMWPGEDGSRRGAARVGPWLQHVELDPAELEVRRTAVEAERWVWECRVVCLTDLSNEVFDYIYHGSGRAGYGLVYGGLCFYVHGLDDTRRLRMTRYPFSLVFWL